MKWGNFQQSYAPNCAKIIDLQTNKKNLGSHKGASPLEPHHPLRQTFVDEENILFGKICYFMIIPGEGK